MTRSQEAGFSLLNVLAVVAVGTTLAHVMLQDQDRALDRVQRFSAAAQADALALGGVTAVAVAWRRDHAEAPEADHLGEPWAQAAQARITLETGTFEVNLRDARGRFDLNALAPAALAEQRVFARLLSVLDVPELLASEITRIVADQGPLSSVDDLARFGLSDRDIARLRPHVTALPVRGTLNLNAVSGPVMTALFGNPGVARGLLARRQAKGALDQSDLAALGAALPALAGFTSDVMDATAVAEVDGTRAVLVERLFRDADTGTVSRQTLR